MVCQANRDILGGLMNDFCFVPDPLCLKAHVHVCIYAAFKYCLDFKSSQCVETMSQYYDEQVLVAFSGTTYTKLNDDLKPLHCTGYCSLCNNLDSTSTKSQSC